MGLEAIGAAMAPVAATFLLLTVISQSAEAILDPLDFLALQMMRKNLEDMPGSDYFNSWDFSADPCTFPGVLCETADSGQERVVALNLGDASAGAAGLRGRIHGSIGCLSALVELTIVPGEITGPLPETLSQCRELQFLGISKNLLRGTIPSSFAFLYKLQTLDLSFNRLSGSISPGVARLPALSNLILCHNQLSGAIPVLSSPNMIRLDLKHNFHSGALPWMPHSLQYLSLSFNQLSGSIEPLSVLENLNYLDLSFNRFSGSIPAAVFGFPLASLQLQRNALTGPVRPERPVDIPYLDLSFNLLTGHVPPQLAFSANVYLNNNHFSGALPGEFIDRLLAGQIQTLYLQHNYLTDITLNPSTVLPVSVSLCVQYNCVVPAVQPPCPFRVGKQAKRPTYQCNLTG